MRHRRLVPCVVLAILVAAVPAHAQFPPDSFTNLRVLPRDIPAGELVTMMAGFTRALGVRCTHCHVGSESIPLAEYDFASDEKAAKRKARAMIEMIGRINGEHLVALEQRADPPVRVECATCHRGAREPRMLQDILLMAYEAGGVDSVIARYRDLRTRYHGRFTYDFSEVPLADVGGSIGRRPERMRDAERVHALNVEMNPASAFARRTHAAVALFNAFAEGAAPGRTRLAQLETEYGSELFSDVFLAQLGIDLRQRGQGAAGLDVLRLNTERHTGSATAWTRLGTALEADGDTSGAIAALERALVIDPTNEAARDGLLRLRGR